MLTTHGGQVSRGDTAVVFGGAEKEGGAYQARTADGGGLMRG